jgi:hypothetical protein
MPLEEQINQWKEKHGGVIVITIGEKDYYFKEPTRGEIKRLVDTGVRSAYDSTLTFVTACLLEPSREELVKDCRGNENLHLLLSEELQKNIGGDQAVSSKKL